MARGNHSGQPGISIERSDMAGKIRALRVAREASLDDMGGFTISWLITHERVLGRKLRKWMGRPGRTEGKPVAPPFYQQIAHSCRGFRQLAPQRRTPNQPVSGCMFLVTNVLPQVRGLRAKRHGTCSSRLRSVQNPNLQGPNSSRLTQKGDRGASPVPQTPPATKRLGILKSPLDSNGR